MDPGNLKKGPRCLCGNSDFIFDRESCEVICTRCGTVLFVDNVDPGPEWRAYNDEHGERRKRIGSPLTFLEMDMGLSSSFDEITDIAAKKRKAKRLRRIQMRSLSPEKRRVDRVLQEVKSRGKN